MRDSLHTLYEHTRHPHMPRNVNDLHKKELSRGGLNTKVAVGMTKTLQSMLTFWIVGCIILLWILLQYTPAAWDKMPFPLLLTVLNIPQISMMIGLGVGQGVLGRHAELQADESFQTTQKSYQDIEQIIEHLSQQDTVLLQQVELVKQVLQRLEAGENGNPKYAKG